VIHAFWFRGKKKQYLRARAHVRALLLLAAGYCMLLLDRIK
jgi:hypothetical protein